MANTGATSHVITDIKMFLECEEAFKPEKNSVETGAADVHLRQQGPFPKSNVNKLGTYYCFHKILCLPFHYLNAVTKKTTDVMSV